MKSTQGIFYKSSSWIYTIICIYVGNIDPEGVADSTVSVIDGASNAVIAAIPVGDAANIHIEVNHSTNRVYMTIAKDDTVYVIPDTTAVPPP